MGKTARGGFGALVRENANHLRFALGFIAIFVTGQLMYGFGKEALEPLVIHKLSADVSAAVIEFFQGESVVTAGRVIRSGTTSVVIQEGCEGIEAIFLVLAAVLAYRSPWKRKLVGAGLALLVIYVANIARIVGLFFTVKHKPELFEFMHVYVGQTAIIIIGLVYFVAWSGVAAETGETDGVHPAV